MKRRRVRAGDVFEFVVDGRYASLQLIGKHKRYGAWAARVVEPLRDDHIDDPEIVARDSDLYVVLIGTPSFEESEGRLRYVGNAVLPVEHRGAFPTFRANVWGLADGRHDPALWYLDDGEREWHVGPLTAEQQRFPFRQITPVLALQDLMHRGWDPEWEFKPGGREFQRPSNRPPADPSVRVASFFLAFKRRADAQSAVTEISNSRRFRTASLGGYVEETAEYIVKAEADADVDVEEADELLEEIAARNNGEYDGNEIPIG